MAVKKLKQKTAHHNLVGLHIQDQGLSLTKLVTDDQGNPCVDQLIIEETDEPQKRLKQLAFANKLANRQWSLVLDHSQYQLILIDVPDVPEDEVEAALKFKVKDLIPFNLEEAVVDVFRLPAQAYRGRLKMAYVAVAKREPLDELANLFGMSGLKLQCIDIEDHAMRNLISLGGQKENGGILRVRKDRSTINLCHKDHLCLNRHIEMGWSSFEKVELAEPGGPPTGFQIQLDTLILEVQRSLDYFESQLGLGVIPELFVLCGSELPDEVIVQLDKAFNAWVKRFDCKQFISVPEDITDNQLVESSLALGASLRDLQSRFAMPEGEV